MYIYIQCIISKIYVPTVRAQNEAYHLTCNPEVHGHKTTPTLGMLESLSEEICKFTRWVG